MKRDGLWTRDFTRVTLATALSIIGGEAINLPVGLLVFDETRSTLLAAVALIILPAMENRRVYEATRLPAKSENSAANS